MNASGKERKHYCNKKQAMVSSYKYIPAFISCLHLLYPRCSLFSHSILIRLPVSSLIASRSDWQSDETTLLRLS